MDALAGDRFLLRVEHATHAELEVREGGALNDSVRDSHETVLTCADVAVPGRAPDVAATGIHASVSQYRRLDGRS